MLEFANLDSSGSLPSLEQHPRSPARSLHEVLPDEATWAGVVTALTPLLTSASGFGCRSSASALGRGLPPMPRTIADVS